MKTKLISILCSVALLVSTISTPLFADNLTQNSTPSTNTNISDGEDFTQGETTFYSDVVGSDKNEASDVYASQASTFAAMIPKVIILDGHGGNATYEVYAKGNIGGTENVYIIPQDTFQLNDVKNIKSSLNGTIVQPKTTFSWNDVMNEQKSTSIGNILVNNISAGNWSGSFNFNIYLKDTIVPVETIQLGNTSLINSETNTIQVAYNQSTIVPIDIYPLDAGTPIEVSSDSPYVQVEVVDDTSTLGAKVDSSIFDKLLLSNNTFASDEKTTINVKLTLKENTPLSVQARLLVKAKTKTLEIPISVKNKIKFDYSGNVQEFIAPMNGTYQLEVYGAQGGGNATYGLGGYSKGNITLTKGQSIYICVGGKGGTSSRLVPGGVGGYNGGGKGGNGITANGVFTNCGGGEGGGGATSITIANRGVLSNFNNYRNEVLIVAGGGGGMAYSWLGTVGGNGGGLSGNNGYIQSSSYPTPIGGTQTTGYAFGQGQVGRNGTYIGYGGEGNGGAGGGWYGGYSGNATGSYSAANGAGGSGYIGGVSNATTSIGVNSGNGYAIVTIIE